MCAEAACGAVHGLARYPLISVLLIVKALASNSR